MRKSMLKCVYPGKIKLHTKSLMVYGKKARWDNKQEKMFTTQSEYRGVKCLQNEFCYPAIFEKIL